MIYFSKDHQMPKKFQHEWNKPIEEWSLSLGVKSLDGFGMFEVKCQILG